MTPPFISIVSEMPFAILDVMPVILKKQIIDNIKGLVSAMRKIQPSDLESKHVLLACSNRVDFSIKIHSKKLQHLQQNLLVPISGNQDQVSLFLARFIKLFGKRCVSKSVSDKLLVYQNGSSSIFRLISIYPTLKTHWIDTMLELNPDCTPDKSKLLADNLEIFTDHTFSLSQKAEIACHLNNFEYIVDTLERFNFLTSTGIQVKNELNLPGEESVFAKNEIDKESHLARRCLRKIVSTSIACSDESSSLNTARRYLKSISPVDDLVSI